MTGRGTYSDLNFRAVCSLVSLCRVGANEEKDEELLHELLKYGATIDFTLVWAHYPTMLTEACKYIGYENEPILRVLYAATALIVDIPRFGTRRRNGTFN
jgi:hypothetical protein